MGLHDLWVHYTRDVDALDWEGEIRGRARSKIGDASCAQCHDNLLPPGLSTSGRAQHKSYLRGFEEKGCVDCHFNLVHVEAEDREDSAKTESP